MNKEYFFPTPIYYLDLGDSASLNVFLKNRIYAWRESDGVGIERSNAKRVGAWHSPTDMVQRPEFELFSRSLMAQLAKVFAAEQYDQRSQPGILNMWANINPPGGYNRSHTHPGALWSGVYYVQAPHDCGQLIFQDPRAQALVHTPALDSSKTLGAESWHQVHYQAIEGRLIIFPSWLQHEVEPNLSELNSPASDRISISFNIAQQAAESQS